MRYLAKTAARSLHIFHVAQHGRAREYLSESRDEARDCARLRANRRTSKRIAARRAAGVRGQVCGGDAVLDLWHLLGSS